MRLALLAIGLLSLSSSAFAQVWYCDPLRVYYPTAQACPVPWRPVTAPGTPSQGAANQPVDNPALGNGADLQVATPVRNDGLDDWCSKATLPSSIAICSDGDLRDLAIKRQKTFDETRARIAPDQQKDLLTGQNGWVRSYAKNCGLPDDPVLPLSSALKQCLYRSGSDRISAIQAFGLLSQQTSQAPTDTVIAQPAYPQVATPVISPPVTRAAQPSAVASVAPIPASNQNAGANLLLVLLIVATVIVAPIVITRELRRRAANRHRRDVLVRADEAINDIINRHMSVLTKKRFQLRRRNEYGMVEDKAWLAELKKFIDEVMIPTMSGYLTPEELAAVLCFPLALRTEAMVAANAYAAEDVTFSPTMTPTDFEHYCAQELRAAGWDALTTKGSGDQGVDVIAVKDERRLVVQCKLYSSPVGNKAVQEISAARMHERAHFAAVVSNASYTPHARQLAATNNVLLLHYSELKNIDDRVFI